LGFLENTRFLIITQKYYISIKIYKTGESVKTHSQEKSIFRFSGAQYCGVPFFSFIWGWQATCSWQNPASKAAFLGKLMPGDVANFDADSYTLIQSW
jgi:hypothetical protein